MSSCDIENITQYFFIGGRPVICQYEEASLLTALVVDVQAEPEGMVVSSTPWWSVLRLETQTSDLI